MPARDGAGVPFAGRAENATVFSNASTPTTSDLTTFIAPYVVTYIDDKAYYIAVRS
jgi:hypothetical protein